MKSRLLLAALLALATPCFAGGFSGDGFGSRGFFQYVKGSACSVGSPASVQHAAFVQATTSPTISVTLGSAVTKCSSLFITAAPLNHNAAFPTNSMSCTDDKGNSYAFVDWVQTSSSQGTLTAWLGGISNSPTTITCTLSGATGWSLTSPTFLMAEEISGLGGAPTLDQHSILSQSQSTTYTSGSPVTTTATDFLYAPAFTAAGIALTAGSGFTLSVTAAPITGVSATVYSEIKASAAAGSTQATYGATGATDRANVALLAITPH